MNVLSNISEIYLTHHVGYGVVIGNFDGVHLGHQELITNFISMCEENLLLPVVYTFNPHPTLYFKNPDTKILLTSVEDKYKKLEKLGIHNVVELCFDEKIQKQSAQEFLSQEILNNTEIKLLYLGRDFKMGAGKCDARSIAYELCEKRGILITEEPPYCVDEVICSSSRLREYLSEQGDIKKVNKFLGQPYNLKGLVIKGRGIGTRELFATINIEVEANRLLPHKGVYLTRIKIKDQEYESITNIGTNPTITNENVINVETHVFYFNEDVYNSKIELIFIDRIRDEMRFKNTKELRKQISEDIERCQKYFRESSCIKLALIGRDISHSLSQKMYERILQKSIKYDLLDYKSADKIPKAQQLLSEYDGVSITAPYKREFLTSVTVNGPARDAINCLYKKSDEINGVNTDYYAAKSVISDLLSKFNIEDIILLGDGSMGTMVKQICQDFKVSLKQFSRKLNNIEATETLEFSQEYNTLVINTCSREYLFKKPKCTKYYFWDMNYNLDTHQKLFQDTEVVYIDGLEMLELQAKTAVKFWNL